MDKVFADRLSHYERVLSETTSQYLLYGFRRFLVGDYHGFVLVQAARGAGRVQIELGVSKVDHFPYHRLRDFPVLGVAGFRESLAYLTKGFDHAEEYTSADSLTRLFGSIAREVDGGMTRLNEKAVPLINQQLRAWQPAYAAWVAAEKTARSSVPGRYPDLPGEVMAYETLDDLLGRGMFDRYLGPLKYRYRNQDFFNCHLYLLAKGLEFLEPPPLENPKPPEFAERPDKVCAPLDDPISALTGRFPQEMAVDLAVSTSVRVTEFAFLQSLAAVEALLQFDERGMPCTAVAAPAAPKESLPPPPEYSSTSLVDEPDYFAPLESPAAPASPSPTASKPRPKRDAEEDDDDPLSALESRLGLR